jgi:hypothetical protein
LQCVLNESGRCDGDNIKPFSAPKRCRLTYTEIKSLVITNNIAKLMSWYFSIDPSAKIVLSSVGWLEGVFDSLTSEGDSVKRIIDRQILRTKPLQWYYQSSITWFFFKKFENRSCGSRLFVQFDLFGFYWRMSLSFVKLLRIFYR